MATEAQASNSADTSQAQGDAQQLKLPINSGQASRSSALGGNQPDPNASQQAKDQGQPSGSKSVEGGAEIPEIKLPDGVKLEQSEIDTWKTKAGELKLNSEQASALAVWEIERQKAVQDAVVKAWEKQSDDWEKALKSDPEIGGANYQANVLTAQKAVLWSGGPELAAELDRLGLGNNPVFVKTFIKIGKGITEDSTSANITRPGNQKQFTEDEKWARVYNHK